MLVSTTVAFFYTTLRADSTHLLVSSFELESTLHLLATTKTGYFVSASVRFLKDLQLRSIETVLRDGKMVVDEKLHAVRFGSIHNIDSWNDGPNNTVDLTFPQQSPLHGVVVGVKKSDVTVNPGAPPSHAAPSQGCKSC
jgi:hypothetical protein